MSWDEWRTHSTSFDAFYMHEFMETALAVAPFACSAPAALEIGCGTGPLSCFLAQRGFKVDGVDISATAIAMAQQEAADRKLDIQYRVADVCTDSLGVSRYDLIVDGPSDFADQVSINGQWNLPTRKLHLNSEAFSSELHDAGFEITWQQITHPDRDGEPGGFQAICRKRKNA